MKEKNNEYQLLAWDLTGLEKDIELLCPQNIDTYYRQFSKFENN